MNQKPLTEKQEGRKLLLEFGQALHQYGTPAHRIELILERLSEKLGLQGQFFAVPTAIIAAFGPLGKQRAGMIRLKSGGVDLGKLAQLDEEIKELINVGQSVHDGLDEIHRIVRDPPPYPQWLTLISFGIASSAGAIFFGGGLLEVFASLIIGIILGLLSRIENHQTRGHVFVPIAAAAASALAYSGQWLLGSYRVDIVTVAGLLYLLPGFTLTIALTELSTRHVVAGTARFTIAIIILLEMAFGVAIGSRVSLLGGTFPSPTPTIIPAYVFAIALIAIALSFVILFKARLKDAPWIIIACAISYYGAYFGTQIVGSQLGGWIGALLVGLSCNAYARLLDRPPTVLLVPSILMLVPGSVGFKSVNWLLQSETIKAIDTAFEMALGGMALAIGMLVANLLLSPRREL